MSQHPNHIDGTELSAATAIYLAADNHPTIATYTDCSPLPAAATRPITARELAIIAAVESGKSARIRQANGTYIVIDGKTRNQRKKERRK